MNKQLELRFKGERDYLHGTDMFNGLYGWLVTERAGSVVVDIDASFHQVIATQPKALPVEELPPGTKGTATFAFTDESGARRKFALVDTGVPVTGRYPYDEDGLVRGMLIDAAARRGVLAGPLEVSAMEAWVAMTKAVHLRVFDSKTKWYFVRARVPKYTLEFGPGEWSATIVHDMNGRLTRSEIACDGAKVAEIFFSPRAAHAGH